MARRNTNDHLTALAREEQGTWNAKTNMSVRNTKGRYAKNQAHRTVPILAALFVATLIAYLFHANGIRAVEIINEPNIQYGNEYLIESATSTFKLDSSNLWRNKRAPAQTADTDRTCVHSDGLVECFDRIETRDYFRDQDLQERDSGQDNRITASITEYSRADSCHNVVNGKCLMASGKPVYEGAVACPKNIPLGTKVRINGQVYTCEDRTADWVQRRNGPTFDIFVEQNPSGKFLTEVEIL